MIDINPREIAAEAIVEITVNGGYSNIVLKSILKKNGALSQNNKSFVTEIVKGTLRNIYYIDYVINTISTVNTQKMKPWILAVIRISSYQILFMDKVPDSAVCNEAVKLVKKRKMDMLSQFVNGVLRNIIRNAKNIKLPCEETEKEKYLSVKYSYPLWLVKMWLCEYDYNFVKQLCEKGNKAPDVTIAVNTLKTNLNELKQRLESKNIDVKDGLYYKNALHLLKTSDISKLDEFNDGLFHIQDESSMIAVNILDPQENETILDICAAPGGKSILSAEKMNNTGTIVSRDIYEHKIFLIEEAALRMGINIIKTEIKNAEIYDSDSDCKFDRVIVDAPCSGFGLLRKKPDIKLTKTGSDIDELIKIQRNILKSAAGYVKKDGILLYSTCTICKKENIKNIEWFIENFDFEMCDISSYLPKDISCDTSKNGYIQFFPNIHNTDGFFVAKMIRKAGTK